MSLRLSEHFPSWGQQINQDLLQEAVKSRTLVSRHLGSFHVECVWSLTRPGGDLASSKRISCEGSFEPSWFSFKLVPELGSNAEVYKPGKNPYLKRQF